MEENCNNCGAKLNEGANFCPECGSKIESIQTSKINKSSDDKSAFCPNCGESLEDSENFCVNCGFNHNASEIADEKKNLIEKYKIPIIIAIIAIVLIISGLIASSLMSPDYSNVELPAQTVTVGSEYFKIPGEFVVDPSSIDVTTESGVVSFSQGWKTSTEHIYIGIITSGYPNVDLDSVAALNGGVHKTLMGYEGYYNENDLGDYSFSFVLDNKICMIDVSSPYLFDEIEIQ